MVKSRSNRDSMQITEIVKLGPLDKRAVNMSGKKTQRTTFAHQPSEIYIKEETGCGEASWARKITTKLKENPSPLSI